MEWTRGPSIGRGSSATVSLATASSGELFAVKSAELPRSGFLQREQHFLSHLRSPHIVEYMGFEITCESNKLLYNLFIEYVSGGTISDELKRRGGSLDESAIRLYTRQILRGLDYLHLNGFVHCDIKGQNVLIGEKGVIKIADLGCARRAEDGGDAASAFSGTPVFMAPEVARGEEQGFPADVWALGCTIIEMATGSTPWPEVNDPVSALYRIGFSGDVPEFPTGLSDKAKDFLSKCLSRDSKDRWTAKQLLQHPFFDDLESDEFTRNSPVSVLDQGFWESVEVSEAPRNLTHMGCSPNSPAERIRHLIEGTSGSNLPNWTWDEDWIAVRTNDTDGSMILSDRNSQLIQTESFVFPAVVNLSEELGSPVVIEDLLRGSSVETISRMDSICVLLDFLLVSGSVKDAIVSIILALERELMEVLLLLNLLVSWVPSLQIWMLQEIVTH